MNPTRSRTVPSESFATTARDRYRTSKYVTMKARHPDLAEEMERRVRLYAEQVDRYGRILQWFPADTRITDDAQTVS